MTTLLHKTSTHEKARAISSGFLELIKALTPNPRQRLASKRTSFISIMKHDTEDNSTTIIDIAFLQAHKSLPIRFLQSIPTGGVPCTTTKKT